MEVSSAPPLGAVAAAAPTYVRRPPVGYFIHESLLVLLFVHVWPLKSIWLLAPELEAGTLPEEASDGKLAGNNEEGMSRDWVNSGRARPLAFNFSQQLVEKLLLILCELKIPFHGWSFGARHQRDPVRKFVRSRDKQQETGGTLLSKHQPTRCCCCCFQYGRRSQTTTVSGPTGWRWNNSKRFSG